jgi:SAM-dependent methyltransferase
MSQTQPPGAPNYRCKVCFTEGAHAEHVARETMQGLDERFTYFKCAACGCLQIAAVPADLPRYYEGDYYSFGEPPQPTGLRRWLYRTRDGYAFTGQGLLGRWLHGAFPRTDYLFLSRLPLRMTDRVLDVGCGAGALLRAMERVGFRHVAGVDPFIDQDIAYEGGVRIHKCPFNEFSQPQDLVMFNHSLEHMPDQQATLRHAASLLSEQGSVVVRVPIVDSYAWENYGTDWVQLDAPRHLFLHSQKSMREAARQAGLEVYDTFFDSSALQFWGSEQCRRGVPLASGQSYHINKRASGFSRAEIAAYKRRARDLNASGRGDQAAFYLRRLAQ